MKLRQYFTTTTATATITVYMHQRTIIVSFDRLCHSAQCRRHNDRCCGRPPLPPAGIFLRRDVGYGVIHELCTPCKPRGRRLYVVTVVEIGSYRAACSPHPSAELSVCLCGSDALVVRRLIGGS